MSTAQATVVPVLGRGIFPKNSPMKWLLCGVRVRFDCAGSHKTLSRSWSLRDLAQVPLRRSCGDPFEILLKRSLHKDFEDALHWCLYESLYEDLVRSSICRSIYRIYIYIYLRSCCWSCDNPTHLLQFHSQCFLYLVHWLPNAHSLGSLDGVNYIYIYIYIYIVCVWNVCMYLSMFVCMCVCVPACVHVCMYGPFCVCLNACDAVGCHLV